MIKVKPRFLLGIRPGASCSAFLSDCIQLCFLQCSTKFPGPGSVGVGKCTWGYVQTPLEFQGNSWGTAGCWGKMESDELKTQFEVISIQSEKLQGDCTMDWSSTFDIKTLDRHTKAHTFQNPNL